MDIASWLTDVYGPRLTGSPPLEQAADWAVAQMKAWGLENVALEPWPASSDPAHPSNSFPRGWTNEKFYMAVTAPQAFAIAGTPIAWTPGTNGLVRGEVVLVTETARRICKRSTRGALKGKWVLASARARRARVLDAAGAAVHDRGRSIAWHRPRPPRRGGGPGAGAWRAGRVCGPGGEHRRDRRSTATEFLRSEGVLGVLSTSPRGHGIYTIGGASRTADPATLLPLVDDSRGAVRPDRASSRKESAGHDRGGHREHLRHRIRRCSTSSAKSAAPTRPTKS